MKTLARFPGVGHFRDGDCFIQSVVNALAGTRKEIDYKKAEAFAKLHNWECDGIRPSDYATALKKLGFVLTHGGGLNCRAFFRRHPEYQSGRHIIQVHAHLFAIVNGIVFDDGRHVLFSETIFEVWSLPE